MMRVAVTGATGFVGGHVVQRLRREGFTVIPLGRRRPEAVRPGLGPGYRQWDLADGPLSDPPDADAVVHCAGAVDDWGTAPRFEQVNVRGTHHVLDTWPRARIIHMSSASVYDPWANHGAVTEDQADPTDRVAIGRIRWLGHYGRTKRMAEHLVATRARGRFVILRPHAVYGPGDPHLLPRILRRYRLGRLVVAGDPGTRLSLTGVANLAGAVTAALISDGLGIFNVSDAQVLTLDEILTTVLEATGLRPRVLYVPMPLAWRFAGLAEAVHLHGRLPRPVVTRYQLSHLRDDFVLDTARIRQVLGFLPSSGGVPALRQAGTWT